MKAWAFYICLVVSALLCLTTLVLWTTGPHEWLRDHGNRSAGFYVSEQHLGYVSDWPYRTTARLGNPPVNGWSIPLFLVASLTGLLPATWLISLTMPYIASFFPKGPDPEARPCKSCGYDLRATITRCPECGHPIPPPPPQ